jgi:hypothetical protein
LAVCDKQARCRKFIIIIHGDKFDHLKHTPSVPKRKMF